MARRAKVKVGDTIRHRIWGEKKIYVGKVEDIEVVGEDDGYLHDDDDELSLDNGHWCYGSQVVSIITADTLSIHI